MNKQTKEKKENRGKLSREKRVKGGKNKEELSRRIVDSSEKTWKELEITDDFMFSKVMRNQELCRRLLKVSLSISVGRIEYPEEQKSINLTEDGRSVRLDVYIQDEEERIYNVEMQVADTGGLPKRSRYWFENRCREDLEIALEDQAIKVFLNAQGAEHAGDEDLKAFLKYLNGEMTDNSFVKELEWEVQRVRDNKEWRVEYMTLLMRDRENMEKGEERLRSLIEQLMREGRMKEMKKAITNKQYRDELYKQYKL